MKFCDRRPGTSISFVDALSRESILQIAADQDGLHLMAFHLYDSRGALVAQTSGLEHHPDGLTITCDGGELLLAVPQDASTSIRYRLYNSCGTLLTSSDGARTVICNLLRMEAMRNWAPPRL